MHHSKSDIDKLYVKRKKEEEVCYKMMTSKAKIINNAEYFNIKYMDDQFVNTVKNHEHGRNQPNMNSTNNMAGKTADE